jgi:hypothetical protein
VRLEKCPRQRYSVAKTLMIESWDVEQSAELIKIHFREGSLCDVTCKHKLEAIKAPRRRGAKRRSTSSSLSRSFEMSQITP